MSASEQLRKSSDQGASTARETFRKGEATAQEALASAQENFQIAGDSTQQMNLKLLEIMRENSEAFFNFAEEALNTRDPGKLASLWMKHAQSQMQLVSKHGMELVGLGQKIASTGVNSVSERTR